MDLYSRLHLENKTPAAVLRNVFLSAVSLFVNGFGVYLTIRAGLGAAPWDVFSLGLSRTLGILYGDASVAVSITILLIDLLLREPIGLSMLIDSVVVGKSVDLFNSIGIIPPDLPIWLGVPVMLLGLFINSYTLVFYMSASLGCGPRDTLLVGLKKRSGRIPIGAVSIALLGMVTLVGWLLGGQVGVGTLICAFLSGPILQLSFRSVGFDAERVHHQHLVQSLRVLLAGLKKE